MIKRIANRLLDVAFIPLLTPLWLQRCNGQVTVFLYHRVDHLGEHDFLDSGGSPTISPSELESDLRFLKDNKFEFLTFKDISTCRFESDKRYAVITFDDGFASVYNAGATIAEQLNIPITVFQCSAMISGKEPLWEHLLYWIDSQVTVKTQFIQWMQKSDHKAATTVAVNDAAVFELSQSLISGLARQQYTMAQLQLCINKFMAAHPEVEAASREQITRLYPNHEQIKHAMASAHEVGSHGEHHYRRDSLTDGEFERELENSKKGLEKITGCNIESYSYPFNSYFQRDEAVCAQYFKYVGTVDGGRIMRTSRPTSLPRNTHPGSAKNRLRQARWLLTGKI